MARSNLILGGVAALALAAAGWQYFENRSLRDRLSAQADAAARAAADPWTPRGGGEAGADGSAGGGAGRVAGFTLPGGKVGSGPELTTKRESVMNRRARITDEIAAMFGRLDGETDEEYRARVMPMLQMALEKPRTMTANRRKQAEQVAGVSPEQSAKVDQALEKVYTDVVDYANTAITDGQISPYKRDVAGWLEFAGGLGAMLNDAQGKIGTILTPAQMKSMYEQGFEWGEYLGLSAPWEQLKPPPPRS